MGLPERFTKSGSRALPWPEWGGLASKLPETVPGISVNRQCGSGLSAIQMASALVLMSEAAVTEFNLTPLVRIAANAVVGSDPSLMLTGPIPVTRRILKKTEG